MAKGIRTTLKKVEAEEAVEENVPRETEVDFEKLTDEQKIKVLNSENIALKIENDAIKRTIENYKQNGPMRMYYALNRKINEMADALNTRRLSTIDLKDGSDKTYDRLKSMWNDAADLSKTVMVLRKESGATDDEEKDMKRSFDIDEFSQERV